MKKFLIKIAILFIITAICDILFGKGMDYVVNHIEVGGQGRDNYICNTAEEDILIFGSSRAVHHYNSSMLEDSLGLTCYNCGDDGNGIILSYGRLLMAKERHQPKIIIQDVATGFDIDKNDNNKYLGWLKARYDREGIAEIFDMVNPEEQYKMLSQMYRYNSKYLQNLFVYATGISFNTGIKGFRPITGEMDTMKIRKTPQTQIEEIDSVKLEFVKKFIAAADNSQLYFVVSPVWYGKNSDETAPIREICQQENIPFIDFSNDPKYVHNNQYFKDGTHLNARGADEFTKDLIKILKEQYNME